jgi:hypothetical protein
VEVQPALIAAAGDAPSNQQPDNLTLHIISEVITYMSLNAPAASACYSRCIQCTCMHAVHVRLIGSHFS